MKTFVGYALSIVLFLLGAGVQVSGVQNIWVAAGLWASAAALAVVASIAWIMIRVPHWLRLIRNAYEIAKRWGSRPVVWLVGIGAVVAVAILIGVLIAVLPGGGEDGPGAVSLPSTPGEGSPTVAVDTPTATVSPTASTTTEEQPLGPRFWLTLPDIPPNSWSTSTPRGMNVYQTAFVSWEDDGIKRWLTDPQSMLPDGEYYRYVIRGATADAPVGAKVSVSATIRPPDSVAGIRLGQGTFVIQEDGTWEGTTQVFPDDIDRSTYTLQIEIRSSDNQLLLRASLTVTP